MPAGKTKEWCPGGNKWADIDKVEMIRCKTCNRRLKAKTILHQPEYGESYGIEGYKVPNHKRKK